MLYVQNDRRMDHTPLEPLDPRLATKGVPVGEPWYVSLALWLFIFAVMGFAYAVFA